MRTARETREKACAASESRDDICGVSPWASSMADWAMRPSARAKVMPISASSSSSDRPAA
jgi:hypothetical protein